MSIRSSARNESVDTEIGEERECRYRARRGTRVPIRSSARNVSADTELGCGEFGKITGAPTHLTSEERENSSTIRSGSSDKKLSVEERKRFGEEM